jgi:hypothetical protein
MDSVIIILIGILFFALAWPMVKRERERNNRLDNWTQDANTDSKEN